MGSEAFTEGAGLTTKGDLLVFSTLITRLPVGSDSQVLTADSSAASGLAWSDAAARLAIKTADQTFANDTLANIMGLSFSAAASTSYLVEAILLLSSNNTNADFKFFWSLPASATMFWDPVGEAIGGGGRVTTGWAAVTAASVSQYSSNLPL